VILTQPFISLDQAPLQKVEYTSLMKTKKLPLTIAVMESFRINSLLLFQSLMVHISLRWKKAFSPGLSYKNLKNKQRKKDIYFNNIL